MYVNICKTGKSIKTGAVNDFKALSRAEIIGNGRNGVPINGYITGKHLTTRMYHYVFKNTAHVKPSFPAAYLGVVLKKPCKSARPYPPGAKAPETVYDILRAALYHT